jgi:hypothetical protein
MRLQLALISTQSKLDDISRRNALFNSKVALVRGSETLSADGMR